MAEERFTKLSLVGIAGYARIEVGEFDYDKHEGIVLVQAPNGVFGIPKLLDTYELPRPMTLAELEKWLWEEGGREILLEKWDKLVKEKGLKWWEEEEEA